MTADPTRITRLSARVDPETHQRIVRAAELSGLSMNQFLVNAATKTAKQGIQQETTLRLTWESADLMMERLDTPRPLNAKLCEAACRHADRKHRFQHPRKSR
ncbi:DUF1778 domain-containing protein [Marinobacter sp. AN1]|uniref:type II toxin-antitoxin system TacA family antitoxin n=1 Tax=Marinobacter sp. AN1 TaxID=2886046 RepID=UPI00222E8C69|nr:DUF1778 domain-containing protein [Marinobacter sp. AN1]UZD64646.1 DUF1778 domain-containing protein [Marinobacter sp. AN1]